MIFIRYCEPRLIESPFAGLSISCANLTISKHADRLEP
jgi:hypothetical protein